MEDGDRGNNGGQVGCTSMGVEDEGDLFTRDVSASILAQVKENIRKQERRKTRRDFTLAKAKTVERKEKGLDLDLDLKLHVDLNLEFEGGARRFVASRASRPVFSSRTPPPSAKEYFKIVRVPDREDLDEDLEENRPKDHLEDGKNSVHDTCFSVYDGDTEYRRGVTLYSEAKPDHAGGFYVYDTVEECLLNHERFPAGSAKEGAGGWRRAIARVVAWSDDDGGGAALGSADFAIRYGGKRVFSYVRLVGVLPFPAGREALASGRECGPAAQRRLRVVKARAETISLKEEVERMEERLRVGRLMQACRQEG